jgi:2-haloacid dehalogenase
MDFGDFDALTFDCYGTLIDWETGITNALTPIVPDTEDLLERFAEHEAQLEAGPYLRYAEVLAQCAIRLGATPEDARRFGRSVRDWPAFPDSPEALRRLKTRFKLGVITNCDDDLFAASNERLQVEFDWVITAEQARGYKPRTENFEFAFERIDVARERILHVAQSLFHDHVPAKALGLTTVWVDRRHGRSGGATPPADAMPDLTVPDLRTLAERATGGTRG